MLGHKKAESQQTLVGIAKGLEEKMAMSQVSCLDCWHFSRRQKKIVNYEGKTVFVMKGCGNYMDCHNGGYKSLWAAR